MGSQLPPPADISAHPRQLLAELAALMGEAEAARCCADLLAGADFLGFADVLPYLGGRSAAEKVGCGQGDSAARRAARHTELSDVGRGACPRLFARLLPLVH